MKKAVTTSVFGLFLLVACKDPNAVSTPTVDAEAPVAVASASAAPAKQCTSDADCRTVSSYCAESPCACQVVAKADATPKCPGGTVSCVVDPCFRKNAACQNGACVLVPKSSAP